MPRKISEISGPTKAAKAGTAIAKRIRHVMTVFLPLDEKTGKKLRTATTSPQKRLQSAVLISTPRFAATANPRSPSPEIPVAVVRSLVLPSTSMRSETTDRQEKADAVATAGMMNALPPS